MGFKITDKLLQKLKDDLVQRTEDWKLGLCDGMMVSLEGELLVDGYGVCHGWVSHALIENSKCIGLSCHKNFGTVSQEATDAIILWMARESPFSKFIINRDDEENLLKGGIIFLCDKSGEEGLTNAQALWVCKVLRFNTEGRQSLDVWYKMMTSGIDPLLALRVCQEVTTIKGATFGYNPVPTHVSVFLDRHGRIKDLVARNINRYATNTYEVFGGGNSESVKDKFKKFCKPEMMDDGWGGKYEVSTASQDEFIDKVKAWAAEYVEPRKVSPKPKRNTVPLNLDM